LTKDSTADAGQVRALDLVRFEKRLGAVTADELELIAEAVCQCVKRQPVPAATPESKPKP
jgi:mRNA-degrading endonuclease toxin of MazEF toxin-antitoxin module